MKRAVENTADFTGKVFGRLTVVSRADNIGTNPAWLTQCECGNQKVVGAYSLTRTVGSTKSCGCLLVEKVVARCTKHGQRSSKEYQCWADMVARCTNPKSPAYADYGGRGITVCERWQQFDSFIADMGQRPLGMSIERKDVNGNYEPGNCIWASDDTQANNKRGLRKYLVDGEWLTASQLGRRWGIERRKAKERAAQYESKIIGDSASSRAQRTDNNEVGNE